jgi:hypothetical protein
LQFAIFQRLPKNLIFVAFFAIFAVFSQPTNALRFLPSKLPTRSFAMATVAPTDTAGQHIASNVEPVVQNQHDAAPQQSQQPPQDSQLQQDSSQQHTENQQFYQHQDQAQSEQVLSQSQQDQQQQAQSQEQTNQEYHELQQHHEGQGYLEEWRQQQQSQNNNVNNQSGHDTDPATPKETYNIYVGNLNSNVEDEDLRAAFEPCGPITLVRVFKDKSTGAHMV